MLTISNDYSSQHFNVTEDNTQHHSVVLKDVNGVPYCFMGFVIKNNVKQDDVIMCG